MPLAILCVKTSYGIVYKFFYFSKTPQAWFQFDADLRENLYRTFSK